MEALFDAFAQESPEARAMLRVDTEIFVHVEHHHARPVDAAEIHQGIKRLNLRIGGGKDHGRGGLTRKRIAENLLCLARHVGSHFSLRRVDADLEQVDLECLHAESYFSTKGRGTMLTGNSPAAVRSVSAVPGWLHSRRT